MATKHVITKQKSLYELQNDQIEGYNETPEVTAHVNQNQQE